MFSNQKCARTKQLGGMGKVQSNYLLSLAQSGRGTRHVTSPKTKERKAIPASVNLNLATVQGM